MARTLTFPGAEGYGAGTLGAANAASPTVVKVTSLSDSGAGTLREALGGGDRFIVFDVGGTITLNSQITITNDNITILGHTAPSDSGGITLRANGNYNLFKLKAHQFVCRHMRFRHGKYVTSNVVMQDSDNVQMFAYVGDGSGTYTNYMFDHCSFSWAPDELVNTWNGIYDVTFQWCIFSEALNDPNLTQEQLNNPSKYAVGRGPLFGAYEYPQDASGKISLHHCLMAHNNIRNPNIQTHDGGPVEVVNNVIYNPGQEATIIVGDYAQASGGGKTVANIRKNYYKAGIKTPANKKEVIVSNSAWCSVHMEGNEGWNGTTQSNLTNIGSGYSASAYTPAPAVPVTEQTASAAYASVLDNAGCRVPHMDDVDVRIIESVKSTLPGGYQNDPALLGAGYPTLAAGTGWTDTDGDGLPDSYETEHGSVSATAEAASGLTHIEEWGQELIGTSGTVGTGGGGDPDPGTPADPNDTGDYIVFQVASNNDTGYQDTLYESLQSLLPGDFSATQYDGECWMRFQNFTVSQGTTITEAYLDMWQWLGDGDDYSLRINAEDTDDSLAYDGTGSDWDARTLTTASVTWAPEHTSVDQWVRTGDIKTVLQEVIDRSGWTSGNSLSICIRDGASSYQSQRRPNFAVSPPERLPRLLLKLSDGTTLTTVDQTLTVASDADDGFIYSGDATNYFPTYEANKVGDRDAAEYDNDLFFRVQLADAIPSGSTISDATVSLYFTKRTGANADLDVYVENTSNAAAPSSKANITGRTYAGPVAWTGNFTVPGWQTIDVSSALQTVVTAQGGLSAGSYVGIYVTDTSSGNSGVNRCYYVAQREDGPALAPKLDITHTSGDTMSIQVEANADDGWVYTTTPTDSTGYIATTSPLSVGDYSSSSYDRALFVRMATTAAIPDTTISSATFSMWVNNKYGGDANNLIGLENVASSTNPADKAALNAKTFTSFSSWAGTWPSYSTADWVSKDVTSQLQTVVTAQSGLSSGAYIGVYVKDADVGWSGTNRRYAITDHDTDPTKAAKLDIVYGTAGTQNLQVAVSADDSWNRSGTATPDYWATNHPPSVGDWTSSTYDFALYFRVQIDTAIPAGATITEALCKTYVLNKYGGDTSYLYYIENTGNSANPTSKATLTGKTFSASLPITQTWSNRAWRSVDLKTLLQEVVDDQSGLSAGSYIGVYIADASSGWSGTNRRHSIATYGAWPEYPLTLEISHVETELETMSNYKTMRQTLRETLRGGLSA